MSARHPKKLGAAVRGRRSELGLTQQDVVDRAAHAGIRLEIKTVGRVENGEASAPRASTLRALDVALEWAPGSAAQVLAGGRAQSTHGALIERVLAAPDTQVEDWRRIVEIVSGAAAAEQFVDNLAAVRRSRAKRADRTLSAEELTS